jgi:hypothetical protein
METCPAETVLEELVTHCATSKGFAIWGGHLVSLWAQSLPVGETVRLRGGDGRADFLCKSMKGTLANSVDCGAYLLTVCSADRGLFVADLQD